MQLTGASLAREVGTAFKCHGERIGAHPSEYGDASSPAQSGPGCRRSAALLSAAGQNNL